VNDARELWKSVAPSGSGSSGGAAPALGDLFVVSTVALPHVRHRADQFKAAGNAFGRRLTGSKASDYLCKTEFSEGIPADSCIVLARGIWDPFSWSSSRGGHGDTADTGADHRDRFDGGRDHDLDAGGEDSLVATHRCDEAFSEAPQASNTKISEYT
jgi:hypothetical protein